MARAVLFPTLAVRLSVAILAAALALGVMRPAAFADVRVAQVDLTSVTDTALAKVRTSEKKRVELVKAKAALDGQYQRELAEVDKLKKQRASWRRDRQLRDKLASSLVTANKLVDATRAITKLDGVLKKQRKSLVKAIDAELAAGASSKRAKALRTARADAASRVGGKKAKKIVLPDDEIDPLADPEDLEAQAKALRASEAELTKQVASLDQQAKRFRKQAELRKQHERADELASRDDGQPRRTSGTNGGRTDEALGADDDAEGAPTSGGTDAETPDPGAFEGDPAVVLSDVVDGDTVDALRKAERSSDPETKADAAERARKAVAARLAKLEKRRKEIEARARALRDE